MANASTAETYRVAALENLARAQTCYEAGDNYFLAHYLFGLAVECHLRAWLRRTTNQFDGSHDLEQLAQQCGFFAAVPPETVESFSQNFGKLNARWRSNHRYYSERQFLDYLLSSSIPKEERPEWNAKGDKWKNLCRVVFNITEYVIHTGEARWNYGTTSKTNTGKLAPKRPRRGG